MTGGGTRREEKREVKGKRNTHRKTNEMQGGARRREKEFKVKNKIRK
jgi:hypothetical protein